MFFVKCEDCEKYIMQNGTFVLDPNGDRIERCGMKPTCTICEKYDSNTKVRWEGFSPRNQYVFTCFRTAYHFGALPMEGGTNEQDYDLLEKMLLLAELFSFKKDTSDKEFKMKLCGINTGAI